ncbi:hypothetical protein [Thiorhodovibrio winogradskyi]|uniref:hypothetical protein n=1 Tax=Thiorhodovibrio winogradskyi TaxID=77007 RepID=UPI002E28EBC8|nr:hypothetical protein [Thiorhodovibrio winogradskyi]
MIWQWYQPSLMMLPSSCMGPVVLPANFEDLREIPEVLLRVSFCEAVALSTTFLSSSLESTPVEAKQKTANGGHEGQENHPGQASFLAAVGDCAHGFTLE